MNYSMNVLLPPRALCCFLLMSFSVSAAAAQTAAVAVRVLFLDESDAAYVIKENGEYRSVSSYPYAISSPFDVEPDRPCDVYKEIHFLDDSGEAHTRYEAIAQVKVSDTVESVLVVIAATASGEYILTYYEDGEEDFPAGTVRVINLGHLPIAASVGSGIFSIAPQEVQFMQPKLDHKRRFFTRVAEKESEQWNILYDDVSVMRSNERMTGIVVYSPSGMRHTYTESEIIEYGPPPPGHYWLSYTDTSLQD